MHPGSWDPLSLAFAETAIHLWKDPLLWKISGSSPHHPLMNCWTRCVPEMERKMVQVLQCFPGRMHPPTICL